MKKNYQKPEIIEEVELDRKVVYASCLTGNEPECEGSGGSGNEGNE